MIDILFVQWGVVIYFQSNTQSWILKNNALNFKEKKNMSRLIQYRVKCSLLKLRLTISRKTSIFITDQSLSCHILNFHAAQYRVGFFWSTLGLFPRNGNEAFIPDPLTGLNSFYFASTLTEISYLKNLSLFETCSLDTNELKYSFWLPLYKDLFKIQTIEIHIIYIEHQDQHIFPQIFSEQVE